MRGPHARGPSAPQRGAAARAQPPPTCAPAHPATHSPRQRSAARLARQKGSHSPPLVVRHVCRAWSGPGATRSQCGNARSALGRMRLRLHARPNAGVANRALAPRLARGDGAEERVHRAARGRAIPKSQIGIAMGYGSSPGEKKPGVYLPYLDCSRFLQMLLDSTWFSGGIHHCNLAPMAQRPHSLPHRGVPTIAPSSPRAPSPQRTPADHWGGASAGVPVGDPAAEPRSD